MADGAWDGEGGDEDAGEGRVAFTINASWRKSARRESVSGGGWQRIRIMKNRFRSVMLLSLAAIAACVVTRATMVEERRWSVGHERIVISSGSIDREFVLYVPPVHDQAKALPLVVMFHGMGGTAFHSYKETSWSSKAEREGFFVAYPEATRPNPSSEPSLRKNPQAWNDGSGRFHAGEKGVDDVAFIRTLLDSVTKDHNVDTKRIFVAGFSNGASMAFRIGTELSDRVASIAPCAGACWTKALNLSSGVSLCYITGTSDPLNPIDGGFPKLALGGKDQGGQQKPPVQDTIDKWVVALNCADVATRDIAERGVRTRRYGSGRNGAEVEFITVDGLGHHWAGGTSQAPEFLVGKNTDKLNATDVVWEFFVAHPKP